MNRADKYKGFTIIELVVTMAVSSIIVLSLVGTVTVLITTTAIMGTRNGLPDDLQTGLQKIASTIRNSDNALLYNLSPDANAPVAKVGEAANVPGPPDVTADDDYRYYWRSTAHQLVLSQPSRNASGDPLYTDPVNGDFTGPRDSTVLYIKDKALYQRVVYDDQGAPTTLACPGTSETGGCSGDVRLVDNIQVVNDVPQFTVSYLDSAGVPIPATLPNGSSNYDARKLTRAVKIDLTLEVMQGNKAITAHDSSIISFRTGYIPGSATITNLGAGGVGSAVAPPFNLTGTFIGSGGLSMSLSTMTGSQINVKGRVAMGGLSTIGIAAAPTTLVVGNQACGTPPNWPVSCTPTQPISGAGNWSGTIYGKVCANGQTSGAGMLSPGLQLGCVPPPIELPTYDRETFINSMAVQQAPNNGACSLLNFSAKTIGPNIEYVGDVTHDFFLCTLRVKGNVHIKGNFTLGGFVSLTVDESVGTKRPIVVVDGNINFTSFNNVSPNSYGTGVDFISFGSTNANCLTTPACRDRTDQTLLHNSSNTTTISLNWVSAPGSTFYSYYGNIYTTLSSTGGLAGQSVTLNGLSTVSGP